MLHDGLYGGEDETGFKVKLKRGMQTFTLWVLRKKSLRIAVGEEREMLRILIAPLLVVLVVSSSCTTRPPDEPQARTEQIPTNHVIVLFSGLMVFHPRENRYEVGIVGPKVSEAHKFSVNGQYKLPTGRRWTMEIHPLRPSAITAINVGRDKRRPDTPEHQFDLNWMVDLESLEFHKEDLTLKPDLLSPIIQLPPTGRLYTQYKSINLERRKGSETATNFGFVPETIGLHIELSPGQELILRDEETGGQEGEVYKIAFRPGQPTVMLHINNTRHPYASESDFRLYYKLFVNREGKEIAEGDQFDFERDKDEPDVHPYNPHPGYGHDAFDKRYKRTCCMMACTAILTKTDPLQ